MDDDRRRGDRTSDGSGAAADESTNDAAGGTSAGEPGADAPPGARDVVVPLEIYKVVTVFSTLIAVVLVVGGFLALDAATRRATLPPAEIDPALTVLGLLAIVGGGVVYAFASRFRAPGMGTSKNDDDQGAGNG